MEKWKEKLYEARQLVTQGQLVQANEALSQLEGLVDDELTEAFTRGQNNMLEAGYHQ